MTGADDQGHAVAQGADTDVYQDTDDRLAQLVGDLRDLTKWLLGYRRQEDSVEIASRLLDIYGGTYVRHY